MIRFFKTSLIDYYQNLYLFSPASEHICVSSLHQDQPYSHSSPVTKYVDPNISSETTQFADTISTITYPSKIPSMKIPNTSAEHIISNEYDPLEHLIPILVKPFIIPLPEAVV